MAGNLVLVRTRRLYTLASTFLRFQEHYESHKFRGEIFSLEEYMDWYAIKFGNFTYYEDWGGFNIPSSILKPFREGKFNPLSRKEQRLLSLLAEVPEPFYAIGVYGDKLDLPTIKHEMVHGLYYTVPEYRKSVQRILATTNIKLLTSVFQKLGYHRSVWKDETNAYLTTGISGLSKNGFQWTQPLRKLKKGLQKTFYDHFEFSLHNANETKILSYFHRIKL